MFAYLVLHTTENTSNAIPMAWRGRALGLGAWWSEFKSLVLRHMVKPRLSHPTTGKTMDDQSKYSKQRRNW